MTQQKLNISFSQKIVLERLITQIQSKLIIFLFLFLVLSFLLLFLFTPLHFLHVFSEAENDILIMGTQ